MTIKEINSLNVSQLRDELRARDIKFVTRDRKAALKAKLVDHVQAERMARAAAEASDGFHAAVADALPLAHEVMTAQLPNTPGACSIRGSRAVHRSESWQSDAIRVETPEQRDRRQARNKAKARRRRIRNAA